MAINSAQIRGKQRATRSKKRDRGRGQGVGCEREGEQHDTLNASLAERQVTSHPLAASTISVWMDGLAPWGLTIHHIVHGPDTERHHGGFLFRRLASGTFNTPVCVGKDRLDSEHARPGTRCWPARPQPQGDAHLPPCTGNVGTSLLRGCILPISLARAP